MKLISKMLLPLLLIFGGVCLLIFFSEPILVKFSINKYVLLCANLLFFLTGILVFFMQRKALSNANPNVFIRSVIGGMMIKMFSTVIAVLTYVVLAGPTYDKKAVFISLFIYLIYLAAEVIAISKENGKRNV